MPVGARCRPVAPREPATLVPQHERAADAGGDGPGEPADVERLAVGTKHRGDDAGVACHASRGVGAHWLVAVTEPGRLAAVGYPQGIQTYSDGDMWALLSRQWTVRRTERHPTDVAQGVGLPLPERAAIGHRGG